MTDPADPAQMTGESSAGFEQLISQAQQGTPPVAAPTPAQPTQPAQPAEEKTFGQDYVHQLREEAKNNRLAWQEALAEADAKAQRAAQDAAAQATKDLAQNIGKALGLVTDDAPVDPEVLVAQARQAQAEAERAKTEADQQAQAALAAAKAKTVEADLYRHAGMAGADPIALLDSRSFMDRPDVKSLDPASAEYASQIGALMKEAAEDPRYRAAPRIGIPRSGGDLSAGHADPTSGAAEAPKSVEDRIRAKLEAGGRKGRIHARLTGGRAQGESSDGALPLG